MVDVLTGLGTLVRVKVVYDGNNVRQVMFINDNDEILGIVEAVDGEIRFFTYKDDTTEDYDLVSVAPEVGMPDFSDHRVVILPNNH
jgi:hypothetical protein